jgi:hypothetical protein
LYPRVVRMVVLLAGAAFAVAACGDNLGPEAAPDASGGECGPGDERPATLATGVYAYDLAAANGEVYWVDWGGPQGVDSGLVVAMCRNPGSRRVPLATQQPQPLRLVVDDHTVYWTNPYGGTVAMVTIATGDVKLVAAGQERPNGVAIDDETVYWASFFDGTIRRQGTDGRVEVVVSGLVTPSEIAVDHEHVFFTDPNGGRVGMAQKRTGELAYLWEEEPGDSTPWALAIDDEHVYWSDFLAATIMAARKDGTGLTVLATGQFQVTALVVDGGYLYWSRGTGIARMSKGGGYVTPLVLTPTPQALAVDDRFVYWASPTTTQTIERIPK